MKKTLIFLFFLCAAIPAFGELTFKGLDLNAKNELLFSAQVSTIDGLEYSALFNYNLNNRTATQLTWYPESMESLNGGDTLQIRNRFGVVRYSLRKSNLEWLDGYSSFISGAAVTNGALPPFAPSPDGRWIVYWEADSVAYGRLIIQNVATEETSVVADHVERRFDEDLVSWGSDSSAFVYESDGDLYFARPEIYFSSNSIGEKFRLIGPGRLSNIAWYSPAKLIYIRGSSVYDIAVTSLFTRSVYADLIGIGELAGKLSFDFIGGYDKFWVDKTGKSLIISRNNRMAFYVPLTGDDYQSGSGGRAAETLYLPASCARVEALWPEKSDPVVVTASVENGNLVSRAFRLHCGADKNDPSVFTPLALPKDAHNFRASPDEQNLSFIANGSLRVYGLSDWKEKRRFSAEETVAYVWMDSSRIYVGGKETTRLWDTEANTSRILFFSEAKSYGWSDTENAVVIECGAGRFSYTARGEWRQNNDDAPRKALQANKQWRVFIDAPPNGLYANTIFLRRNSDSGETIQLISEPAVTANADGNGSGGAVKSGVFTRGGQTNVKQVALTFDALDNAEGLPTILYTLKKHNLKATFFVNGEFIRRHPAGVQEIVGAGHQVGSMFFTSSDLATTQYRIDEDFIMRGLARAEDEFYAATGAEITLLWHPAYYLQTDAIIAGGRQAGYTYIGYDVDPLDWVTLEHQLPGLYKNSADLVEALLEKKRPGSIIPIRVGKPEGTRADYLYEKLDLIITALAESGYGIVTVTDLMKINPDLTQR